MPPVRALIILHPGFEEIEAVVPIDLLARAGIEVVKATLGQELMVSGRSGISMQADRLFEEVRTEETFDVVILPGGPGISKIRNNADLCRMLQRQNSRKQLLACICAAPLLLLDAGLTENLRLTAHPATLNELPNATNKAVEEDRNIITSRGAGTSTEFALSIITHLKGNTLAANIAESICWPHIRQAAN